MNCFRRISMLIGAAIAALFISGCQSLYPSEGQLKELRDLNTASCVESPGWNGSAIKIHFATFGGKASGTAGGGGESNCGSSTVKFNNEGKLPSAASTPTSIAVPVKVIPVVTQ